MVTISDDKQDIGWHETDRDLQVLVERPVFALKFALPQRSADKSG